MRRAVNFSPAGLAQSVGYDSFEVANSQYGAFAHLLCNLLNFTPEEERRMAGIRRGPLF
jgi:hypothetical protein